MRGMSPSGVFRTGFILPLSVSDGGSSSSPLVYDGQGDIIDCGIYLSENDWIDQGGNVWTTAENTFPPNVEDNYVPGWYKFDTTTADGDNLFILRDAFLAETYLDGLDMSGKEVIKQFSFINTIVTVQGQAAWLSATDNISIYSVGNPYTYYGTMIVPDISFGIACTASNIRFKNYSFINCGRNAFRGTGISNIEIDGFKAAYTGGSMSSVTGARAGDVITFNGGTVASVSDIRVTNSHIVQAFDIAISMQLFSSAIEQTANNIEFDNNTVGYACSGLSHACHAAGGHAHTITNAVIRDNVATDIGYGWGTYQTFITPCAYGSYNRGNPYTYTNLAYADGGTVSGSCYNNTANNYAGNVPTSGSTQSGINTWGQSGITIDPNTNNTFTNYTDDYQLWIGAGSVCFNPYTDGFPIL